MTGHTSAHAPQRLEANGSQVSLGDAVKLRRDDRANGPGVNPGIIVAADFAVHGAMIQARAAADAVQRLAFFRIGQQLRPAIVEQQQIEFVGTIDLVFAARSGKKRRVDRQRLAGGAAAQQIQKYRKILRAGNHLFEARDGDVNLRRRSAEPRVAFVLHHHDGARIGDQEIRAADADTRLEEFLS